jgi:hypothetical protein
LIPIASNRNYEDGEWIERSKKYLLENTGMLNIGIGSEIRGDVTDFSPTQDAFQVLSSLKYRLALSSCFILLKWTAIQFNLKVSITFHSILS